MIHGHCRTTLPSHFMVNGQWEKNFPGTFRKEKTKEGYSTYKKHHNGEALQVINYHIDNRYV